MAEEPQHAGRPGSRDPANWAKPISELHVGQVPDDAINLNVEGRRLAGITGGFGKMWQKTYRVALGDAGVSPADVIRVWKAEFPTFWTSGNRFFGPLAGISPGDVALLNVAMPGRVKLSTGILVIYADDVSFSFMTPEGHMFNGMITFSAQEQDGTTVAQISAIIRAQDPLYELGMLFGGHRKEDRFWLDTLRNLAARFEVEAEPTAERLCVDRKRQWRNFSAVRHNAALRSGLHAMGAPARMAVKPLRRRKHA